MSPLGYPLPFDHGCLDVHKLITYQTYNTDVGMSASGH